MAQSIVSSDLPVQLLPPFSGSGSLHNRFLDLVPLPQVFVQSDQESQSDHCPSKSNSLGLSVVGSNVPVLSGSAVSSITTDVVESPFACTTTDVVVSPFACTTTDVVVSPFAGTTTDVVVSPFAGTTTDVACAISDVVSLVDLIGVVVSTGEVASFSVSFWVGVVAVPSC